MEWQRNSLSEDDIVVNHVNNTIRFIDPDTLGGYLQYLVVMYLIFFIMVMIAIFPLLFFGFPPPDFITLVFIPIIFVLNKPLINRMAVYLNHIEPKSKDLTKFLITPENCKSKIVFEDYGRYFFRYKLDGDFENCTRINLVHHKKDPGKTKLIVRLNPLPRNGFLYICATKNSPNFRFYEKN